MTERPVEDEDLRWAAEVAPRLLEEARAEALEEVRARLRGRLVDALLWSTGLSGAHEEAPAELSEPEPRGLWAYGVLEGDAPELVECRGVDPAHDVELIRHAGLAAIVSEVPLDEFGERGLHESLEDLDRLELLARAHQRVLEEALRRGAVVPFRICTIYESAARVREMLAEERDHLTVALRRLHGMAEWGVKAYAGGGEDGEGAAAAEAASGTDYLVQKRAGRDAAELARQDVDAAVDDVHARLREQAADAVLSPLQSAPLGGHEGEMVLNAAYLVADADVDRFGALVAELGGRHAPDGVDLELTGPWPAYHFSEPAER
ncbi:MAG TPA: GvpL/GvpF family gas vesicle protein [Solirubrobacteraceae bacterium]|nr:GvpL/GvpF family gas vesicle protein [Solirubrobacteraceae bacterium]